MTDKMKPVRCGCGGEARVSIYPYGQLTKYRVKCEKCGMLYSVGKYTEAEAITAWNRAMSGSAEEKLKAFWDGMSAEMKEERTAKVEGNRCTACDNYIRPCMKYCDYCGARLEWE